MMSAWGTPWQTPDHTRWATQGLQSWSHLRSLSGYNEVRMLKALATRTQDSLWTMTDVGCGAGRFYPLLKQQWPRAVYAGYDVSVGTIEAARTRYPKAWFSTDPPSPGDLVFVRDVTMHQTNPLAFLTQMYALARQYLVLRERTRLVGETVYDPEQSCRYSYGFWMPYIVFNQQHLIQFLCALSPRPVAVTLWTQPTILGGVHGRYLPKALYDEAAGGGYTAIFVEKGENVTQTRVQIELKNE